MSCSQPYRSCNDVRTRYSTPVSGIYSIQFPEQPRAVATKCMFVDDKAWTLIARIDSRNESWHVTDNSHSGHGSHWEAASTFGEVAADRGDYKSIAFSQEPTTALRVHWNQQPVAETVRFGTAVCPSLSQTPTPMAGRFQSLQFRCKGVDFSSTPPPECTHWCKTVDNVFEAADGLFAGAPYLFFQAGEIASYNPDNNDRGELGE